MIVHNSVSTTARDDGIRQVHEWYRLAQYVSTRQLNAIESTKDSVEHWLAGTIVPSSHEQGKRSTIIERGALLKEIKTNLQTKGIFMTAIAAIVGS